MSIGELSYFDYVGSTLRERRRELSLQWLERLVALLPVDASDVFTSSELLDHIPCLVGEIGVYVAAPDGTDIAANTVVTEHARQLGQLRHRQHASVHQVLREYDLLADLLAEFVAERTTALENAPAARECLEASRRVARAVRVIMQTAVATFIGEYTDTITAQAARIDQFNRAISHELRNVFGTLQFSATLLANASASTATHRERVAMTLSRNIECALHILRSLEKLPVSGALTDRPTEQIVDLAELVGEVFRQLHEMAGSRDVALHAAEGLPRIYVDTGRLELVLVNLVANAIKYSDADKTERLVEITASTHEERYELRVRDNGIGIPAEAVGSIFERFQRAHQHLDSTLGIDGTGLGLAIVQEFVTSLGGDIRVETEQGVGTSFIVTLPKRMPPLEEPGSLSA